MINADADRPAIDPWGRGFDPDRLAALELAMWKAYYRRQGPRLFGLLVRANHEQAGVGWLRALRAAFYLARAAVRFGRSEGDYQRFEPDIIKGYQMLRLPRGVDAGEVARRELRWWVVRREIGLAAGDAAGDAITALYAAIYRVPEADVQEAGSLRGEAAEVRDRGAAADPEGPAGTGDAYWPEVERLLHASYRSLRRAVAIEPAADVTTGERDPLSMASQRVPLHHHVARAGHARGDQRSARRRRGAGALVAFGLPRCPGGRARSPRWGRPAGEPVHQGLAAVLAALAVPGDRVRCAAWLQPRGHR